MPFIRIERLQKELLKLTNSIFKGDISDPRLSGIDITRLKLSKDMRSLKLYFSGYDKIISEKEIIELLNKSSGYIKKQIAGASIMRTIPQINFEYDNSSERIKKIEDVFTELKAEKRNNNYYDDDSDNVYYDEDDNYDDDDLEDYDEYQDELEEELDFEYDEVELEEDDD
jgi:ribosome-binding factor A